MEQYGDEPGYIPCIDDFSKIVQFGTDSGGAYPFAFDFRENPGEPSVIYWYRGAYWRRVALNFETSIALYQPLPEDWDPGIG
jgi:SMI1/KNR4 family protein SUKH-1